MKTHLKPDNYLITVAIDNEGKATNSFNEYLLRLNDIATLKVLQSEKMSLFDGVTDLNPIFRIEKLENPVK
jgi:hypothetical protein